jgi:hypothetical protein
MAALHCSLQTANGVAIDLAVGGHPLTVAAMAMKSSKKTP